MELGSGTCEITLALPPAATVTCIELSPEMITHGKAKTADLPVTFVNRSMFEIDQVEGTFDAIITSRVFLHLDRDDLAKMLQLCAQKLKPGGVLAFDVQRPNLVKAVLNRFEGHKVYNFPYSRRDLEALVAATADMELVDLVAIEHFMPLIVGTIASAPTRESWIERQLMKADRALARTTLTSNRWGVICARR